MGSSVNLFNTGKSALFTNRAALATTGHNIANVNTQGYSRQRIEQTTAPPSVIGNVVFGTGVKLQGIMRVNDEYLTRQIANESKLMGSYEEKDLALAQAESVFNEIGNAGLNRFIARFFNEFRKLGNEPESEALRATVREAADQLVGDFHRVARSLRDVQHNLDVRVDGYVKEANELAQNIAKLNNEIKMYEVQGAHAADLRDARDLAIKKLSALMDVNVSQNEKGEVTLSIYSVGPLVSGHLYNKLYTRSSKADPETGMPEGGLQVYMEGIGVPKITDKLQTGKLGGIIETRDKLIGEALHRMDQLAYSFSNQINEIHRQGFSINGSTALDFFAPMDTTYGACERIGLSQDIRADVNNIATAMEADAPGDNRICQLIGKMQHAKIMSGGTSTYDDHYNATVSDLATVSAKNKELVEHETHILNQLEKFRESISGVSLDEETTNLVQYQHCFDAAAKVIKVADEMLQTVLGMWKA